MRTDPFVCAPNACQMPSITRLGSSVISAGSVPSESRAVRCTSLSIGLHSTFSHLFLRLKSQGFRVALVQHVHFRVTSDWLMIQACRLIKRACAFIELCLTRNGRLLL